jgi:hypothetical protein
LPPKDQCSEHGERLAATETRVDGLENAMNELKTKVSGLQEVVGKLGIAWWIVAGLFTFGGSIVGNVVAAAIAAHK